MWGIEKKLLKSQCCVIHALHHGEKVEISALFCEKKYIVAGTSQVETSKLLITSDEKKSQVAEGHA